MNSNLYVMLTGGLIESSNFLWSFISGLLVWRGIHWKRGAGYNTSEFVIALQWVLAATAIRQLWFALSRFFADTNGSFPWNEVMFTLRPLTLTITTIMFTYGAWRLVSHLEERSGSFLAIVAALVIGLSFFLGYV